MPGCLKSWQLNVFVTPSYYAVNLTSTATGGGAIGTKATVLVPDTANTDIGLCSAVSLSGAEYKSLLASIASAGGGATTAPPVTDIDYALCAQFWAFGLSTVVTLYLVSKYVGEIVGFIRTVIR